MRRALSIIVSRASTPALLAALLSFGGALAPSCTSASPLAIAYLASWDARDVEAHDDGTWSVTTDRGFVVHVLEGSLSTYAVTLVPCEDTSVVAALLAPAVAFAGHVENADASQIEVELVDPIGPGGSVSLGETVVPSRRYCRAHYLVAGGVRIVEDLPVRDPSLSIAFEARDADGELVRTSSFSTTVATGSLADIEAADDGVRVTFVRPLATLFDGLDLADSALTDAEIAQWILLAISRGTRVVTEANASTEADRAIEPSIDAP